MVLTVRIWPLRFLVNSVVDVKAFLSIKSIGIVYWSVRDRIGDKFRSYCRIVAKYWF